MLQKTRKAAIIGAGHVGAYSALVLAAQGLCDEIVLIDTNHPKALAQAADLMDGVVHLSYCTNIYAGGYDQIGDADVVLICAGNRPYTGQPRSELLKSNLAVVDEIIPPLKDSGFHGVVISVTNPCDIIARLLYEKLGLPAGQIISSGTALDSARLRKILADQLGVDPRSVQGCVLGEHGESQVIPWSNVSIAGEPLFQLMKREPDKYGNLDLGYLSEKVRHGAKSIIAGKGYTQYGIGLVLTEIVQAILHNERRVLPVSAFLAGEYGQQGVFAGVPAVLGRNGVERIVELPLTENEMMDFVASCAAMREFYSEWAYQAK